MKKIYTILACLLVFGCSGNKIQPITTVDYSFPTTVPVEKMEEAIVLGATERGWTAKKVSDGVISAQLNSRGHEVVVLVNYTGRGYEIKYRSSKNMLYSSDDNMIHKKYTKWVNNLSEKIRTKLYRLKAVKE